MPAEIRASSILVGHWGDVDCMSRKKDVVVPTITPVQHDLPRFGQRLQPAMRKASKASFERSGPLLLFAGDAFQQHCHEVAACPSGREVVGDAASGPLVNGALAGAATGDTVLRGHRVSLTVRHLLEFLLAPDG